MSWRGVFVGALALCALEVIVAPDKGGTHQPAQRFGDLLTAVGAVINHLIDPTVAAIPNTSSSK